MMRVGKSARVGRKWVLGIFAAIGLGAAFLVAMALAQPPHAWAWMLLLLLYIPIVPIAAGMLKYLVLLAGWLARARRRSAS